VENLIIDALARVDEIHAAISNDNVIPEVSPDAEEAMEVDADDMEETIWETTQPVWEGCSINRLQAGIVFMNMCNLYGVPNTFLDELLTFLSVDLLPRGNNLTRNSYETKQMVTKMGLPRFVPGSNKIPVKVLRYFPIIFTFLEIL
jgi:hypothetical protein